LKPTWRYGEPPKNVVDIGVALGVDGPNIVVIGLLPDSPATHKDVHVGDRLLAVAQGPGLAVPVRGENLARAVELIRGPAGTRVRLTIVPAGKDVSHARVASLARPDLD
jgi:carboxyl-terminal processing protease